MTLEPAYRAKNGPIQTVEELLMVKGFNGRILYGEDYNSNGYLDQNEDDGPEGLFPPDDGDGVLDRGLLSYVTVYSWDMNSGNDNKARVNINAFPFSAPDKLPEYITEELSSEVIEFIAEARKRGYKFRSVGELVGLKVFEDGSSNYDEMWQEYIEERANANKVIAEAGEEESSEQQDDETDREAEDDTAPEEGGGNTDLDRLEDEIKGRDQDTEDDERDSDAESKDRQRRQQSIREGGEDSENEDANQGRSRSSRSSRRRAARARAGDESATAGRSGGAGSKPKAKGTPVVSPATAGELAVLMDRLTVVNTPVLPGLINVNTAPLAVLRTIPGLTEEEVQAIVGRRSQVGGEEKMTTAWLVSAGALEPRKFSLISNQITARSIQFMVDVIGFADHVGTARRIQAVVEMRGQLAQLRYYRDISSLGMGYPVWDDQRSEGFSFDDR